jgi:hypothetical protein
MRRWVRRTILALLLLIAAAVVLSGVGVAMFKGTPSWYAAPASTSSQREQFARAAENKLIDAQNWAGQLRADNVRADRLRSQGATTLPATRAAGTLTIEF